MLVLALVMILQCACAVAPAYVVEGEAELIVSDESQYNKTSYSLGANPTGAMKEHKTRTFGDLTDDMTDINKNVYKIVEYFDAKYAK